MTDEIRWINHAGYELRTNGVRIVHDPWTDGLAFADGWALVSPTAYTTEDFSGVDYIWFSHEHPDHFSPALLRKIPENVRATITILYQKTRDHRVVDYCRKLGFAIQELEDGILLGIGGGVKVTCGQVNGDSWLCTQTTEQTYFNANDVVGIDWHKVAASINVVIDVLLTQFSYASWVGNPGDTNRMAAAAQRKFVEIDNQIAAFKPKIFIPFASFIWFCRDENFHLNSEANHIDSIYGYYRNKIETIVLYPDDCYNIKGQHDSLMSIKRYSADWATHKTPIQISEPLVILEDIIALASGQQERLEKNNWMWLLTSFKFLQYFAPVNIYVADLKIGIRFSMFGGILQSNINRDHCGIEIGSVGFAAMLKNGYGYGTYGVNGRFLETKEGAWNRLSRHFAIPAQNEQGYYLPSLFFRPDYFGPKIRTLIQRFLRVRSST